MLYIILGENSESLHKVLKKVFQLTEELHPQKMGILSLLPRMPTQDEIIKTFHAAAHFLSRNKN